MKRCYFISVLFVFLLSACAPNFTPIASIAPSQTSTQVTTNTSEPTSTNTPVPTETVTSSPMPTSTPSIIPPKIYTQKESAVVNSSTNWPILTDLVFMTKSNPMVLSSFDWFSTTKESLKKDINSMIWSFNIDGITIPLDNLVQKDITRTIKSETQPGVRFYTILGDWITGIHHATVGWSIDEAMNDGVSDNETRSKRTQIDSTIFVFNGETKEKNYKKWPIIYKEDFSTGPAKWSSGKMGRENDVVTYKIQDGKFIFNIDKANSRYGNALEYGLITSDKYFLSVDTKILNMSDTKSPCFGFSFNRKYDFESSFPVNYAGICNINGKSALAVDEYSTASVGKSTWVILHEDLTNITNLSLLVNGTNVQYFVNEKKVYEKYIPGIVPGRTFGFYIEFLPGSSMHFELDNFKLAMPVNMDDLTPTPTP